VIIVRSKFIIKVKNSTFRFWCNFYKLKKLI